MLLKKKKDNRHKLPTGELNIVSLMDVLTTLLFFLMILASVSKLYIIPATSLISGTTKVADNKPAFSLEVILLESKSAFLYLGPVQKLGNHSEELTSYLAQKFKGNETTGYYRKLDAPNAEDLLKNVQAVLIQIKRYFPNETKAVVAFTDSVPYQLLVDALESVRKLGPEHKPIQVKTVAGHIKSTDILFPQVIVTEWTGTNSGGA